MTRRRIEISFLVTLLILTLILFKNTVVYKSNLPEHPLTYPLFGIVSIGFVLFNYRILRLPWSRNILYSVPAILVSLILAIIICGAMIAIMLAIDQQRTPLGWTFNYTWFSLLIFGILLVVTTELIGVRMIKNNLPGQV